MTDLVAFGVNKQFLEALWEIAKQLKRIADALEKETKK